MEAVREKWTDERLDDLNVKVDRGFERVDRRFEAIERRFERFDERFERMETRMNDRFDEMHRLIYRAGVVLIAAFIGLSAAPL